mmetsp:Transcript_29789/g.43359  ORF Transcript_29789/g.43359 Transcript_29789/m.43359 type:complete len:417 (+) Transcript_29789:141-1391(+)
MRRQAGTISLLLLCLKVSVSDAKSNKNEYYQIATPFPRAAYLKRPLVWTRGGSSQQEEYSDDSSRNNDTWMKVCGVLDIESTFFGEESDDSDNLKEVIDASAKVSEADAIDQTTESSTGDIRMEVSADETLAISSEESELNQTEEVALNLTFYASKYGDGSESDPDGLPTRFLKMQKGCRKKAKEAFDATVAWRNEYDINNILRRSNPNFDACKAVAPHYFPGRDPHNNIIFVQRPGMLDMERAQRNDVTLEDLAMHYVYIVEYCWNLIEPGPPDGIMTNVIDMSGMTLKMIRGKTTMKFAKKLTGIMSANYPSRSFKTLIINAPHWFSTLYKMMSPLLRESTKAKIQIHCGGEKQDAALCKVLGDSVPAELLITPKDEVSDGPTPGPNSSIEQEMRSFCIRALKEKGLEMKEVMA